MSTQQAAFCDNCGQKVQKSIFMGSTTLKMSAVAVADFIVFLIVILAMSAAQRT